MLQKKIEDYFKRVNSTFKIENYPKVDDGVFFSLYTLNEKIGEIRITDNSCANWYPISKITEINELTKKLLNLSAAEVIASINRILEEANEN